MPHIQLNNDQLPGITGLFDFRPDTAAILRTLAETLLRGESSLSRGDRELIAATVSNENDCTFCHLSHTAAAMAHLKTSSNLSEIIQSNFDSYPIEPKLNALLQIAKKVRISGKEVKSADILSAKKVGATDLEIHDTVLIAAAFCMFNRYVDGLNTNASNNLLDYVKMGENMAKNGYSNKS